MADTNLKVRVSADTKQFKVAMAGVSQSMYAAGGAASRFGTVARSALNPVAMGMTVVAMSAVKMAGFIKKATVDYIEFNDTLARTRAILADSNGVAAGMEALEANIRHVGRTTRFTASEVAEAANLLAIAGVKSDEMVSDRALENLVKFAIAGGTDIETATNIGIAGVKAFGMEMEELGHVSDVLTRTFTRSNVNMVSLGEGLKFAAPVAHSAGINIQETAAAVGALGNAGLRGTVAGTGLRMSINKLLKPTFDAQRAMNDLGLTVQVLSPAGESAKNSLMKVTRQLDSAKKETTALTDEMRMLNGQMTDLSIEQKRNSLAISQMRARAASENRDLTQQEIDIIERLEKANSSLALSEEELDLQRMITRQHQEKAIRVERELDAESKTLLRTVEQQTTGITSLGDVLDQLSAAGATTTQILEIFGVRGGTAMASLLSQKDAFHELVEENYNAAGATDAFTASLQQGAAAGGSAKESLLIFNSALDDAMKDVGLPFTLMLENMANMMKGPLTDAIKENQPAFDELARTIGEVGAFMGAVLINAIPDMIAALRMIAPIVAMLAFTFRVLLAALAPVFQLFNGIYEIVAGLGQAIYALVKGNWSDIPKALKRAGSGVVDAAIGAATIAVGGAVGGVGKAVATGGIKSVGRSALNPMSGLGAGKVTAGAGVGTVQMGINEFAEGGFVNGRQQAIVGEAGPEVIIPLGADKSARRNDLMNQAGMGGINIGDIVINGGSNLTAEQVRDMLIRDLPKALQQSMGRGVRGVL